MNFIEDYYDSREKLKEITLKGQTASEVRSSFVDLSDNNKLLVLDHIIKCLSHMFGPYAGTYAEGHMIGSERNGDLALSIIKSKDGYQFLDKLSFYPQHTNLLLDLVKKNARYIADYADETSRDGTTSVGILGSYISKALLVMRLEKDIKVPSSIVNASFDIIGSIARTLVNTLKVPVIDEEGKLKRDDLLKNAIRTTVDREQFICDAYDELIENILAKDIKEIDKIRILNPIMKTSAKGLKFELLNGIKVKAQNINPNLNVTISGTSAFYILDGFLDDKNFHIFKGPLESFVREFSMNRSDDLFLTFFITRNTQLTRDYYEDLMARYPFVKVVSVDDDITVLGCYEDFKEIFKEVVIDLNAINHMLSKDNLVNSVSIETGSPELDKMLNAQIGDLKDGKDTVNNIKKILRLFLPIKHIDKFYKINIPNKHIIDSTLEKIDINKSGKTADDLSIELYKYDLSVSLMDPVLTLAEINFDGELCTVNNTVDVIQDRIKGCRTRLQNIIDKTSYNDASRSILFDRLNSFKTNMLKVELSAPSKDEMNRIKDLYEDSIGVFESTTANGVLCGSNIFFIKYFCYLEDLAKKKFIEVLDEKFFISNKEHRCYIDYLSFFNNLLICIMSGLKDTYNNLSRGQFDLLSDDSLGGYDLIHSLDEPIEDSVRNRTIPLLNIDLINLTKTADILEPARTTIDVFLGALNIARDFWNITCIYTTTEFSHNDACVKMNNQTLIHKINFENRYELTNNGEEK